MHTTMVHEGCCAIASSSVPLRVISNEWDRPAVMEQKDGPGNRGRLAVNGWPNGWLGRGVWAFGGREQRHAGVQKV